MKTFFRIVLLVLAATTACTGPQPVPTPPGPGPAPAPDAAPPAPFTAKIFNCHLPVVSVERDSAAGDVSYCLDGSSSQAVDSCVALKLGQYNDTTTACLIRDLGADANAAVLAGSTDQGDRVRADNARAWILEHQLGYE